MGRVEEDFVGGTDEVGAGVCAGTGAGADAGDGASAALMIADAAANAFALRRLARLLNF